MLAQNFKTPVDLGISETEHRALIATLGYLEREDLPGILNLNMWAVRAGKGDCGTNACIAGWAWIFSDCKAFADIVGPSGTGGGEDWVACRPKGLRALLLSAHHDATHAPSALRNYLTHGEPRWAEALEGCGG